MPVDTRIAALFFVVPFTVAVCIVAVETDFSSNNSCSALLVFSRNSGQPEDPDDR
jgi:hypothetical protein